MGLGTDISFDASLFYILSLSIYVKHLGMSPFKVRLFQGCKSKTEPINTKSVMQHDIRYQVLLAEYHKADTSCSGLQERNKTFLHEIFCATCYTIPSIVGGILQSQYQVLLLSCNML
jgi:hypothetical protein